MTAKDIQDRLRVHYSSTAKYAVDNVYIFDTDWESDFFIVQNGSGYAYEFEVKVSRSDFKADFDKVNKHLVLSKSERIVTKFAEYSDIVTKRRGWDRYTVTEPAKSRPNRFYFVVPDKLVSRDEVPDYAGLIYVSDQYGVTVMKKAPLLHKEAVNYEKALCMKLYHRWRNSEFNVRRLESENKMLQNGLKKMSNSLTVQ